MTALPRFKILRLHSVECDAAYTTWDSELKEIRAINGVVYAYLSEQQCQKQVDALNANIAKYEAPDYYPEPLPLIDIGSPDVLIHRRNIVGLTEEHQIVDTKPIAEMLGKADQQLITSVSKDYLEMWWVDSEISRRLRGM